MSFLSVNCEAMEPFCQDCSSYPKGAQTCYLKLRTSGKTRELLQQCFAERHQRENIVLSELYLQSADLSHADLRFITFQQSDFTGATLHSTFLHRVRFEACFLDGVNLENAILEQVDFRHVSSMRKVRWFQAISLDVFLPPVSCLGRLCVYEFEREWTKAEYVYRHLKELYKNQGQSPVSGLFFEQEMEMQRRQSRGWEWLTLTGLWLTCGYGERPVRSIGFAIAVILTFAIAYFFLPLIGSDGVIQHDFGTALYFSVITFTTLGYGDIRPEGIARVFAAIEALTGAFTVALFVFVFCRRMTR